MFVSYKKIYRRRSLNSCIDSFYNLYLNDFLSPDEIREIERIEIYCIILRGMEKRGVNV